MKRATWLGFGVSAGAASVLGTVIACSSWAVPPPPPSGNGGQCSTSAGQYPVPNCVEYAPDAEACNSPALSCPTTPCAAASPCLAMGADNSGQTTQSLRLRKLNVTAPASLATPFVQKSIIDLGINLHNYCGEGGDGTFSWLLQIDTAKNTITTGGAPPTDNPFTTGYCFVNTTIEGLPVGPVTVPATKGADGTWASAKIPKLYVPIYIGASVDAGSTSVVVLPISGATVKNITVSPDGNCIGQYNANAVYPMGPGVCDDNPLNCARWTTAGSLGGYITLDDADGVYVPQLQQSLCVQLTHGTSVDTSNPNEERCIKSGGHVVAQGDYCSTTDSPGGCRDSYWLAATFAGSAARIVAPNQPACMGGGAPGDAGPADSGAGTESGPQDAQGQ